MTESHRLNAAGSPSVVLVHGAFTDGSSWFGVIRDLQTRGLQVLAPANPLRGIAADSAYLLSLVNAIPGPVLLVGHSYGGAVITNAGAQASNVVGLVYVAASAPDQGETLQEIGARFAEVPLVSALRAAVVPISDSTETEIELVVDSRSFPAIFAADLPREVAAAMAVAQRPIAATAFAAPARSAAWRFLPSWYVVATADRVIHPKQQRFYAKRAGSVTVEMDASHAIVVSRPKAIADLIRTALGSLV
jgi:pimeloyl-ACP methyl ester carboxylesterase